MKKLVLVVALLLCMSSAFALDLTVGPDLEFVLNKDIKCDNLGAEAEYSAQYYDIKADINLGDLVTVSPKLGINSFELTPDISGIGEVDVNGGIGWNVGLDMATKAYETKYVDLNIFGSYRYSRTDIDSVEFNGREYDNPFETVLANHEWEIGIKGSKDLKELTGLSVKPYLGFVYSDLRGKADINTHAITGYDFKEDIKAEDHFGIRTGFTVTPIANLNLNLGAKLVDETAVMGSVSYKF